MVNKPQQQPPPSNQSNQQPLTTPSVSLDALKRKFQRVNQEIVKQNVLLQEQAARIRQENHRLLQENVKVKSRAVALESKLREAEGVCTDTKKSIADRIEMLEAIGEHLISVTKFLRILSHDEVQKENDENENIENNVSVDSRTNDVNSKQHRRNKSSKLALDSIAEEQDLKEITSEIGDVSLKEDENKIESVFKEVDKISDNKRKRK